MNFEPTHRFPSDASWSDFLRTNAKGLAVNPARDKILPGEAVRLATRVLGDFDDDHGYVAVVTADGFVVVAHHSWFRPIAEAPDA